MPPESDNSQWKFAFALGAFALIAIFAVKICPVQPGSDVEDVPKFAAGVQVAGTKKYGSRDYMEYKFQHIIISEIEFKETPLNEVLDELREASVANDSFETDPPCKGVNIFAKFDEIAPHTFEESAILQEKAHSLTEKLQDTKITLALKNITVEEAVRQITQQAGVTFRVERYAVALVTLERAEEYRTKLITREYKMPPSGFLPPVPPTAKTAWVDRDAMGASTNRLAIRDTQEHLDEFDNALEEELEQSRKESETKSSAPTPTPPESPELKRIHDKLSIVIPRVEFRETSLRDALAFLKEKSVELDTTETDPARKGINIVEKNALPSPANNPKITLSLKQVPLSAALGYAASQAGLRYTVDPQSGSVVLKSTEDGDPLIVKEYKMPVEFLADRDGHQQKAQKFLESTGVVSFPPGSTAAYIPDHQKLVVRNTESNIQTVTQIMNAVLPQNSGADIAEKQQEQAFIREKLDSIIIPQIDFKDASVKEAVDFLNKKTAETPGPRSSVHIEIAPDTGLNAEPISPALPEASPQPTSRLPEEKITLTLTDIPLGVAIDYATKLANKKMKVEPYAVVVEDLTEVPDLLYIKIYKVPPDYPPPFPDSNGVNPGKNNAAAREQKMTAREHLEMAGVQFPPGGSAAFIPGPAVLVVRNTQANLELVEEILKSEEEYRQDQERLEKIREETLRISQVKNGSAVFPVLVSFQLRVKGNWVGIVDSDGSVYSGEISQPDLRKTIARFNNRDFSNNAVGNNYHYDPAKAADSPLAFRVTGTNITLNMPVVFEGVFVPGIYERGASDEGLSGTALRDKIAFGQMVNTRIQGRAQVGYKTIDIDTGPAPSQGSDAVSR